jgi:hypothetical protein
MTEVVYAGMRLIADCPAPASPEQIAWSHQHGIDPDRVPVPSIIAYDEETRRLWFSVMEREDGSDLFSPGMSPIVQRRTYVQLEAKPLPFPQEMYP